MCSRLLLVQDDDQILVVRVCRQLLEEEVISAVDRLLGSQDLNPIGHLWDTMYQRIRKLPAAPKSVDDLTDAPIQMWKELPPEHLCPPHQEHVTTLLKVYTVSWKS